MRVGLVTEFYYPDVGGMPEHVHNLALELQRRGHQVTIITADVGPERSGVPNSVPVVRVGKSRVVLSNGSLGRVTCGPSVRRQLTAALNEGGFDIIHVHSPNFPVLPLLAISCAPQSATLVGTLHTHYRPSLLTRVFSGLTQRYLDALDGIIAVAENAARSVARDHDICYRIIPNGVDLDYFGSGQPLRELDDDKLNIVFLGRLEPRNDIPRMLAAFAAVRREMPRVRLVLVGDGPLLSTYRDSLDPRLRPDVVFAGRRIQDRADYLASGHVFCFPARLVSAPMALREAMAAGLASIANDIDGCRELIEDGRSGLLVSPDGVEPLARAMLRLLRDPEERARLGAAGRRRVAEYAWPLIAERGERYYLELRAGLREG